MFGGGSLVIFDGAKVHKIRIGESYGSYGPT